MFMLNHARVKGILTFARKPKKVNMFILMANTRAEVSRLAGKGKKKVVTAPAAADAREAAVQIAAFQKAFEHVLLDGAAHATRSA